MSNPWPFGKDADREDPLTALRIAVTERYSRHHYLVAFDRDSEARPTDAEAQLLASYLEHYKRRWYREFTITRMAALDLDVDDDANMTTFRKYGPDDWAYNRRTWAQGPAYMPPRLGAMGDWKAPMALEPLLDQIHTIAGQPTQGWQEWKATHPDIFTLTTQP